MTKEKDIVLPNDKLMLSGNLSELQSQVIYLNCNLSCSISVSKSEPC